MGAISLFLVLIVILVVAVLTKHDPNKWYGKMIRNKCSYQWVSRRKTPPARCPRCSANKIRLLKGQLTATPNK